jgi:hypothetical protein
MKIRRTEFLIGVAVVTSAVVLQVREYTLQPPHASAGAARVSESCRIAPRDGLIQAACVAPPTDRLPAARASAPVRAPSRLWV